MYLWSCVKQDIEQFRCRTLYFNCYLDRILLLSNCIGPKARDLMVYLAESSKEASRHKLTKPSVFEKFRTSLEQILTWSNINFKGFPEERFLNPLPLFTVDVSLYQNWTPSFRTLAKSLGVGHPWNCLRHYKSFLYLLPILNALVQLKYATMYTKEYFLTSGSLIWVLF
jgi:hypothetical protein